jgi:holo-ACP synthase/triphosphoribosyl-dephospho-CoA synthase
MAELFAGAPAAGLEEILAERENRVRRQKELLTEFGPPLLCLTLNIPGPCKNFPWTRRCFAEGLEVLKQNLRAEHIGIRHEETCTGTAGCRGFISAEAGGLALKALAVQIEEQHPLGRLFDIDVLDGEGKIPRTAAGAEERKCLVCGGNAFACGRSRAHTVEELSAAVLSIMEKFFRARAGDLVSAAALGALLGEAAITPKPGLVDRANKGAHRDMDFFTFIDSTAALLPWFRDCAEAGFASAPAPKDPQNSGEPPKPSTPVDLFNSLRRKGKIAEQKMREASGGANTHRGLIFSLGLLSAAFGSLYRRDEGPGPEALLDLCRRMTAGLHEDFTQARKNAASGRKGPAPSHGEALYLRHGISGVRGEVSRGFPAVRDLAYPALLSLLDQGHSLNDAGVFVLLRLLAHTEDTNIIHRAGPEELKRIQEDLSRFFAANPSVEEARKKAEELDREFIKKNISPGGSADLLAITLFLYRLLQR